MSARSAKAFTDLVTVKGEVIGGRIGGLKIDHDALGLAKVIKHIRQGDVPDPGAGVGGQSCGGLKGGLCVRIGIRPFRGTAQADDRRCGEISRWRWRQGEGRAAG